MLLALSVLLALLFILSGAAAVVQHNKLRESRRRTFPRRSQRQRATVNTRAERSPVELRNTSTSALGKNDPFLLG